MQAIPTLETLHAQGQELHEQGKYEEALACYTQMLSHDPTNLYALLMSGNAHFYCERYEQALNFYKRAELIEPNSASLLFNIGLTHQKRSTLDKAQVYFERCIALQPTFYKARLHCAQLYEALQEYDKAIAEYRFVLTLNDHDLQALSALGSLLRKQEQCEQALTYFQQAAALEPDNVHRLAECAYTATMIGNTAVSIKAYNSILNHMPHSVSSYHNLGYNYKMCGDLETAIAMYQKALALNPQYHEAEFSLALTYLQKGDFQQGWYHHQPYLKQTGRWSQLLYDAFHTDSLEGMKILLRPEGGLGDTLQFIRYAQLLHNHKAHVTCVVQKPLMKLLANCPYIDSLIPVGAPMPVHDAHTTLMSLPSIIKEIPNTVPYLYADTQRTAYWKSYLAHNSSPVKIGVCWQADLHNDSSRFPVARRGIPLPLLATIFATENCHFYSLQKGDGEDDVQLLNDPSLLELFDAEFDVTYGSFTDTAAVITNLDLIITVDTAIAHLAGGLGVPVWLLLPYSTDWRWLAHRSDSPWYPTMKIFQQPAPFDWQSVIDAVQKALHAHRETQQ